MFFSSCDLVYRKFNSFIKEKYFSEEHKGESILFSFDSQSLSQFLDQSDLTEEEFKKDIINLFHSSFDARRYRVYL